MTISTRVKMAEAELSSELIEEMRKKAGKKLYVDDVIFNDKATKRAIKRFADAIGDPNPLWRNPEYAKKTKYNSIVAPPSWIFSALSGVQFGWRGLAGFHIATEIKFINPIFLNDSIQFEATYLGFEGPRKSRFAEKVVIDSFEEKYLNENRNELIAVSVRKVLRAERKKARMLSYYANLKLPHPWKEEELKKIEDEVLSIKIRGNKIRYWEDVQEGEELYELVKGPIGVMDMIAAMSVGLAPARIAGQAVALEEYRKRPAWAFRDPDTYAMEPLLAVHYNKEAARAMGLPYPYDLGPQRQSWYIQHITNWIGDDGWLKWCYGEYRRFVFLSDVIRFKSRVVKKYIDREGEPCVDIETNTYNQRGENVLVGRATVVLPSKQMGYHPLDKRVRSK